MTIWKNDFVIKNKYSRPGTLLKGVKKLVLHYTANPGATAESHKKYFDGSDGGGGRYASAHIFVDSDSAVCIIPLNEVAYHANDTYQRSELGVAFRGVPEIAPDANFYTIGVEMCLEKDGSISPVTIDRTTQVMAELCKIYKLKETDIVRHYDVTHKPCPKPFVDHPEQFIDFKNKVYYILNPVPKVEVKQSPKYPGYLLKKSNKKDSNVVLIQKVLGITADGYFGPNTLKAVKEFQKKNKLVVDGLIGVKTWNSLFN